MRYKGAKADTTRTEVTDAAGRLHLDVPLGPGNPDQQSTPQSQAAGGPKVFSTRVTITAVPSGGPRTCASRRSITFRSIVSKGARILSARATVAGRRRALRHSRRTATLSLAGLPKGGYRVALSLKVRRQGRTRAVRQHRTFRTCTPKGR